MNWRWHHFLNALESALLVAAMLLLMAAIGWLFGGMETLYGMLAGGIIVLLLAPRLTPPVLLRMMGAQPLAPEQAPRLFATLQKLAGRSSGLAHFPHLYHLPTPVLNAFSTGIGKNVSITISDGLLRALDGRELAGVLAHEISHIRHKDIWVMVMADLFSQMTWTFSLFGQLLLLINLPLWLMHRHTMPWAAIILLLFAPTLSMLLQLALSRKREFDADLGAMELTHDPEGLAGALQKMEDAQEQEMQRLFPGGERPAIPSWLRTHPDAAERIRRLHDVVLPASPRDSWERDQGSTLPTAKYPARRHHFTGFRL
ncbi:zinc metalloprotease HtpX [Acidithiobacillus sp.]